MKYIKQSNVASISLARAWGICLLAALFYAYDFILRIAPSVMMHPLMHWFDANAAQIGLLFSFYYYAYTPMQVPSGILVDKFSLRKVLSGAALSCVVGAVLLAWTQNLYVAYIARALMGFGSAFAIIGSLKLASVYLPANNFALFSGLIVTFGTAGAMSTDLIASRLVVQMGWQNTMFLLAFGGFILCVLLFLFIPGNKGNQHKADIQSPMRMNVIFKEVMRLLLRSDFWINALVGTALFLPISVLASLWGVDFLSQRFGVSMTYAASMTSMLFLGMAASAPFFGWTADIWGGLKSFLIVASIALTIIISLLLYANWLNVYGAYLVLFLTGFAAGPQSLTFVIVKEMVDLKSTGVASASLNTIITLGAAILQPVIGWILVMEWKGGRTNLGTPLYSLENYRTALTLLVACIASAIILSLFLPTRKNR